MLNKHEAKHYNGNSKFNMLNKLLAFVVVSVILLINTTNGILSYLTAKTSITNVFTLARAYTVEFDANGGTGTMPDQEISINTYTNLNTNLFTKQDFVFTEWNTEPDGSGTSYDDGESVIDITAEDTTITLYAQWEELLGVAEVNGQYFESLQEAINAAPNNTKTTVRLLANVSENITITKNKNIVLNLQNYTVINSGNNPTVDNYGVLEIQNGTLTKTTNIEHAVINNNQNANLKIAGTSIIAVGSNKSQAIYNNAATLEISGNSYITAQSTNRPTVTSVNGAHTTITGGTIISENYNAVSNVSVNGSGVGDVIIIGTQDYNLDTSTPIIQGYSYGVNSIVDGIKFYDGTIKGYNKAVNNNNYIIDKEDGSNLVSGTEDIGGNTYKTLYLSADNAVTFDGNGGTSSQPSRYVSIGDPIGELPTATWAGHIFVGWFTDPTGGTQISENTIVTGNDTYYAHWTESLTIQYNANGGKVDVASVQVLSGNTLGTMPTPIKSRSRFDGWFTSANGGTEITPNTPITQSRTLYAHWTTINAARVNGTEYATLQDAINAVPTTGVETVVELLCYDKENVEVSAGQNIVFNFNGHTLENTKNAAIISNHGEIKISDGTITSSVSFAVIDNYNSLVITGGNIIATGNRQAIYNNGGTVEISGTAYLKSENLATDKQRGTVHNLANGTVTIKGGTIVALKINAVYNESGTVTIGEDDGTVSTSSPVIQGATNGIKNNNGGTLNFYDGIVKVPTAQTLISGTVSGKPTGYDFVNGTETIDGVSYKTSYLDVVP